MLSRPEYFPTLKNIATGGNPLISEEESPPRKQKQHDRNNPTSKSNKTTANNFESDSGVASSHEEEWASNNSGKKYANLNALFKHLIKVMLISWHGGKIRCIKMQLAVYCILA